MRSLPSKERQSSDLGVRKHAKALCGAGVHAIGSARYGSREAFCLHARGSEVKTASEVLHWTTSQEVWLLNGNVAAVVERNRGVKR